MNSSAHDKLIIRYLENQTTPSEEEEFRRLLSDEAFRRRAAKFAIDFGHLYEHARQGERKTTRNLPPELARRKRRLSLAFAGVAVVVLVGTATAWLALRGHQGPSELSQPSGVSQSPAQPPKRAVVARIANVKGRVLVADGFDSKNVRAVAEGSGLHTGEMLKTSGVNSFALLEFDDNSVMAVAGNSRLTCSVADSQKRFVIQNGDIMAQVASQPDGKPMLLDTPTAQAEVVGTRLSLYAGRRLTELAVMEGRVRLRRLSDDGVIEVREGEVAIAAPDKELTARAVEPVSSLWQVDFEQGLPGKWELGTWVTDDLPPGAAGAVRAVRPEEEEDYPDDQFIVASSREWWRGLFRVEEDTYFNFTYKLQKAGWFNVMVETRSDASGGTYTGAFLYKNTEMWKMDLGRWRSVTVPLKYFRSPERADVKRGSPKVSQLVFRFYFSSQETDPGLVIDRIWITRGAPGTAEVLGPWH